MGVGTGGVEAEARKILWERLCGPMGHHLLLKDHEQDNHCMTESELLREEPEKVRRCWRDVGPGEKTTENKTEGVEVRGEEARKVWDQEVRSAAAVMSPRAMKEVWDRMREVRCEVWREKHPASQRKIDHLQKKSAD